MLFNSLRFLIFFPVVFLLYWLLPFRYRKYMLLVASYYFYMCWKPEFIVLILFSTAVDYFCGLGIGKHRDNRKTAKIFLGVSLCMNLGLLFFFKYFNFFGETVNAVCESISIPFSVPMLNIILPVGISFYTFQTLSYTIDIYRGKLEPEPDFVTFALFVSFFPQLVAGPIEKAENLLPQLRQPHAFSYENALYGIQLMAWGFFKKLVIADRLAILFVDPVYNNLHDYTGAALLVATAAFAIQIPCDFGGYSDIARGCAKMMGIDLMVNFKAPYLATSIADYWRREHISLSKWFREYVYFSLGGNRKGELKKYLFIFITFTLSGLWHGASWNFVIWGMLHAIYLNTGSFFRKRIYSNGKDSEKQLLVVKLWGWLYTFFLAGFARIFFRARTFSDAVYVIKHIGEGITNPLSWCKSAYWALNPGEIMLTIIVISLLMMLLFDLKNDRMDVIQWIAERPATIRWPLYVIFLLALIILIPHEAATPFLYFQF